MNSELAKLSEQEIIVQFGVNLISDIEAKKAECQALTFDTPANYKVANKALAEVRDARVGVEKRRKELKADALEYGRKVDAAAKQLTGFIAEVEDPLQAKKDAIDRAKTEERERKAAAERIAAEERARLANEAREAELRAIREAEEKRIAEERVALEAEKARLEAELKAQADAVRVENERVELAQAAERAKLKAEREAFEAEQAKARAAQEAEVRRIAEEKRKAELEEAKRLAKIEAEREAAAMAERERVEAEERRVAELERAAALKAREDALRPDKHKLVSFVEIVKECIYQQSPGKLKNTESDTALEEFLDSIEDAANKLLEFAR